MSHNDFITVKELYSGLCEKIPTSLSCDWDNDGLSVCSDSKREVKRILLSLDPDGYSVDYAVNNSYDCLISHHPLLFSGLKAVNDIDPTSRKVLKLILGGAAAMSFHTRLDALEGGVNDTLCELLGLTNVEVFGQNGETIGRVGYLKSPMPLDEFASVVKSKLGAPTVTYASSGRDAYKVAVLGGGGAGDVRAAELTGADTYLTGELKYHQLCDAPYSQMNLIEAGHYYTELPVLEKLKSIISDVCSESGKAIPDIDILNVTQIKTY